MKTWPAKEIADIMDFDRNSMSPPANNEGYIMRKDRDRVEGIFLGIENKFKEAKDETLKFNKIVKSVMHKYKDNADFDDLPDMLFFGNDLCQEIGKLVSEIVDRRKIRQIL